MASQLAKQAGPGFARGAQSCQGQGAAEGFAYRRGPDVMLLRLASESARDEYYHLALNGEIEKLRQLLTDYRPPGPDDLFEHVPLPVTYLLRYALFGGTLWHHSEIEDVGDRGELVRLLIHYGADGSFPFLFEDGTALIHNICYPAEAAALLDNGADIDKADRNESTPLMFATCPVMNRYDDELVRFLVRRGANVFLKNGDGEDAEAAARRLENFEAADFLRDVKAAGGIWQKYLRAPRIELVRLRSLCDRGRAAPPLPLSAKLRTLSAQTVVLYRLFGVPSKGRLPNEVFWHILEYWRTRRDGCY